MALRNCAARLTAARSSAVEADAGAGVEGGGVQAKAAYQVRNRILAATSACQSTDLDVCTRQCNAALRDAQAKQNPALINQIKEKMNSCSEKINSEVARGEADASSLTSLASASNTSANQACAEGETCGAKDPNIQNASSGAIMRDSENRCPAGMFWAARWNQCAGIGTFTPRDMIPGK